MIAQDSSETLDTQHSLYLLSSGSIYRPDVDISETVT